MSWKLHQVRVRKLIDKKGRENVKMPYLIKKMLEKKYGKKYD